jgi:diguanylate cyclase (GGDEF)-like protein
VTEYDNNRHTGGSKDPAGDIRKEIARGLAERADAIISGCVGTFPYNGRHPLEAERCERLGRRLLSLLRAAISSRLDGESDNLAAMQRLVSDRGLPTDQLFSFAYLMERTILDELALDPAIGARPESWASVAQAVRRASFDVLGAYCDRVQQESTSPPITDKLTTVYSRAMMDVVLSTEMKRAERFSFPIALAVFDVDKLAELNRSCGYGVGDRLLERLGILIRKFFRKNDWVFRHGEDSIAVLLCQVAAEDAAFLSSRVVAMVEQRLGFKDHNTEERVRVTVTAAVVTGRGSVGEPLDAERLLLEADSVMKRAKSLGGNRVESAALAHGSTSAEREAQAPHLDPQPASS